MDTTNPILPNVVCSTTAMGNRLVVVDRLLRNGFVECHDLLNGQEYNIYRLFLTPMPSIPGKFKQHQFDQVAAHIGRALEAYPSAVTFDPAPLSVETFARKIREAIQAKKQYGWKNAAVSESLWAEHADELVTAIITDGKLSTVIIGTSHAVKNRKTAPVGQQVSAPVAAPVIHIATGISLAELETFCNFLHHKILVPAPIFTIKNLRPDIIESLENRYDIAIIPLESDPDTFQIIS